MNNLYVKVAIWFLLIIANFFLSSLSFGLISAKSDIEAIVGLILLLFSILMDIFIIKTLTKKP